MKRLSKCSFGTNPPDVFADVWSGAHKLDGEKIVTICVKGVVNHNLYLTESAARELSELLLEACLKEDRHE